MKKILIILTLITGLIACNKQKDQFPDFDYTTGYFPYQYPVRTLVLGDYIYDNTNDNSHKFLISAAMGASIQILRIEFLILKLQITFVLKPCFNLQVTPFD